MHHLNRLSQTLTHSCTYFSVTQHINKQTVVQ